MNFGKIQADIIKNIYKANLKGTVPDYEIYKVALIDRHEYIPAVYKRISVILIPANARMLSFELAKAGNSGDIIEKLFDSLDSVEQLTDTKTIKLFGDKQLKEFRAKNDRSILVDEKLLTPFGKDVRFFINENSETVYIKDASGYLGLVMATKIK